MTKKEYVTERKIKDLQKQLFLQLKNQVLKNPTHETIFRAYFLERSKTFCRIIKENNLKKYCCKDDNEYFLFNFACCKFKKYFLCNNKEYPAKERFSYCDVHLLWFLLYEIVQKRKEINVDEIKQRFDRVIKDYL